MNEIAKREVFPITKEQLEKLIYDHLKANNRLNAICTGLDLSVYSSNTMIYDFEIVAVAHERTEKEFGKRRFL